MSVTTKSTRNVIDGQKRRHACRRRYENGSSEYAIGAKIRALRLEKTLTSWNSVSMQAEFSSRSAVDPAQSPPMNSSSLSPNVLVHDFRRRCRTRVATSIVWQARAHGISERLRRAGYAGPVPEPCSQKHARFQAYLWHTACVCADRGTLCVPRRAHRPGRDSFVSGEASGLAAKAWGRRLLNLDPIEQVEHVKQRS